MISPGVSRSSNFPLGDEPGLCVYGGGGRAFEAKAGAAAPASPALISGMNVRTNGGRVNHASVVDSSAKIG